MLLAFLVESHQDNILDKFDSLWPKGLGGDSI